jgi:hypothetical protein
MEGEDDEPGGGEADPYTSLREEELVRDLADGDGRGVVEYGTAQAVELWNLGDVAGE